MKSIARPISAATFVVIGAIVLVGCAGNPPTNARVERAKLDPQSSQIVLPLEAYAMNWVEIQRVEHANAVTASRCMKKQGLTYPRAGQDLESLPAIPDRRYGLWSALDAESNGYELPRSAGSEVVESQENSFGEDWWKAVRSCLDTKDQLPLMGVNSSPQQSVVDRGMNESFDALLASEQLAAERSKWIACIEREGLAVNPDARVLVPQFPSAGEKQLKVAAVDVGCKAKLNVVQSLADLEASTQSNYIAAHESELKTYRESVEAVLRRAEKVLTTVDG